MGNTGIVSLLGRAARNKDGQCPYCNAQMGVGDVKPTREHLIPRLRSWTRTFDFYACEKCNNDKSVADNLLALMAQGGRGVEAELEILETRGDIERLCGMLSDITKSTTMYDSDGEVVVTSPLNFKTAVALNAWMHMVVKGLYFLEKGRVMERHIAPRVGVNGAVGIGATNPKIPGCEVSESVWLYGRKLHEGVAIVIGDRYFLHGSYSANSRGRRNRYAQRLVNSVDEYANAKVTIRNNTMYIQPRGSV